LPASKRRVFEILRKINIALTKGRPRPWISRTLLKRVHEGFGDELTAIIVGGAFSEPQTLQFFYDLGIPVVNAYGLTEGGTGVTVNDLKPFRADTVGKPLPGIEVRIAAPDVEGIGEVAVRGRTVMSGYLNDPEMTAETIVDGWLMTGDMGRFDATGHLQLFGRRKNMIVTEEGKNVYAEDVESAFEGLNVKEFCVFAANFVWPQRTMTAEKLVLVIHLEPGQEFTNELKNEITARNNRLTNYKRVHGIVLYPDEFPLTASMKVIRKALAQLLASLERDKAILPI
jgi:long-chain acyl-CoA synthetase